MFYIFTYHTFRNINVKCEINNVLFNRKEKSYFDLGYSKRFDVGTYVADFLFSIHTFQCKYS